MTRIFVLALGLFISHISVAQADVLETGSGECLHVTGSGVSAKVYRLETRACDFSNPRQNFTYRNGRIAWDEGGGNWCVNVDTGGARVGPQRQGWTVTMWSRCGGGAHQTWAFDSDGFLTSTVAGQTVYLEDANGSVRVWPRPHPVPTALSRTVPPEQKWSMHKYDFVNFRPTNNFTNSSNPEKTPNSIGYTIRHPITDTSEAGIIHQAALAATNIVYDLVAPNDTTRTNVAEECPQETTTRLFGANQSNVNCLQFIRYLDDEITFFVASNDTTAFLVFRGSNRSWPANLAMESPSKGGALIGNPGFPLETTHYGLAWATNTLYATAQAALKSQSAQNKRLIITGHSMGGMIAGYLTFRLMRDETGYIHDDAHLVTFGAPRYAGRLCSKGYGYGLFNFHFNQMAKAAGLKAYSVEVTDDPVVYWWANGAATCADRVGKAIDYDRSETSEMVLNTDGSDYAHVGPVYYDIAYNRWGGRNLARAPFGSSKSFSDPCSMVASSGARDFAIDGVIDGTITTTVETNSAVRTSVRFASEWLIDLGASREIETIRVHGRTGSCTDNLSDFEVGIRTEEAGNALWKAEYTGVMTEGSKDFTTLQSNGSPTTGRYVYLRTNTRSHLNFTELEVFGP